MIEKIFKVKNLKNIKIKKVFSKVTIIKNKLTSLNAIMFGTNMYEITLDKKFLSDGKAVSSFCIYWSLKELKKFNMLWKSVKLNIVLKIKTDNIKAKTETVILKNIFLLFII